MPLSEIQLPGVPASLQMSPQVAKDIASKVQTIAGVRIDPANREFLTFRLNRRLQALGLTSYEDYLRVLAGPTGAAETARLVEMLVTHTTSFFREPAHFTWLAETGLPDLAARGAGRFHPLTIWSAACSTGPELWTAGIVTDRFSAQIPGGIRWGLVGSDVSASVLRRAQAAVFSATELSGLTEDQKRNHFLRSRPGSAMGNGQTVYRVAPELRNRASFSQANLLQDLAALPLADVVFLRNVLIYFSAEDRARCLGHVLNRIRPGGYLILGHSDNVQSLPQALTACGPAILRKD